MSAWRPLTIVARGVRVVASEALVQYGVTNAGAVWVTNGLDGTVSRIAKREHPAGP